MTILEQSFGGRGLYLLDEPEAALSPTRQLKALARIHELVVDESQFIIATHSPILLSYPNAWIYRFDERGCSAVQLLKQGLSSSPEDYPLFNQISDIYMLAGGHQNPTDARENYVLALEYGEKCYGSATSEEHRFYALTNIAQASLALGEEKRAEDAANQLLAMSSNFRDDWNFGNAVFDGNTILGKIKFMRGDIEAAGKYLIAASQNPGSPQLDSFGRDFRLCEMLIDKNQM